MQTREDELGDNDSYLGAFAPPPQYEEVECGTLTPEQRAEIVRWAEALPWKAIDTIQTVRQRTHWIDRALEGHAHVCALLVSDLDLLTASDIEGFVDVHVEELRHAMLRKAQELRSAKTTGLPQLD